MPSMTRAGASIRDMYGLLSTEPLQGSFLWCGRLLLGRVVVIVYRYASEFELLFERPESTQYQSVYVLPCRLAKELQFPLGKTANSKQDADLVVRGARSPGRF